MRSRAGRYRSTSAPAGSAEATVYRPAPSRSAGHCLSASSTQPGQVGGVSVSAVVAGALEHCLGEEPGDAAGSDVRGGLGAYLAQQFVHGVPLAQCVELSHAFGAAPVRLVAQVQYAGSQDAVHPVGGVWRPVSQPE